MDDLIGPDSLDVRVHGLEVELEFAERRVERARFGLDQAEAAYADIVTHLHAARAALLVDDWDQAGSWVLADGSEP